MISAVRVSSGGLVVSAGSRLLGSRLLVHSERLSFVGGRRTGLVGRLLSLVPPKGLAWRALISVLRSVRMQGVQEQFMSHGPRRP